MTISESVMTVSESDMTVSESESGTDHGTEGTHATFGNLTKVTDLRLVAVSDVQKRGGGQASPLGPFMFRLKYPIFPHSLLHYPFTKTCSAGVW